METRRMHTSVPSGLSDQRRGRAQVDCSTAGMYWSPIEKRLVLLYDPAGLGLGLEAIRSAGAETVRALQKLSEQWSETVHRRAA